MVEMQQLLPGRLVIYLMAGWYAYMHAYCGFDVVEDYWIMCIHDSVMLLSGSIDTISIDNGYIACI